MNRLRQRESDNGSDVGGGGGRNANAPKSKKSSRRRIKRTNSRDSDLSYEGGGDSDASVVSTSYYHQQQQQQQYIEPPSYNQPAYQPAYSANGSPSGKGGLDSSSQHRRTHKNAHSNHSRGSDDEGGYKSMDDNHRFPNQQQLQQTIQQQVHREQQHPNSPPIPKRKKGLSKFLKGKSRRHKSDGSLSSRNSSRRPFGRFRKKSHASGADFSNKNNNNNHERDGIPLALSFGKSNHKSTHSSAANKDRNNNDFSDFDHSQSHNPNDSEYEHGHSDHDYAYSDGDASRISYEVPMVDHSESESHRSGGSGSIWNRSRKNISKTSKRVTEEARPSLNQSEHLQIYNDSDDGDGYSRSRSDSGSNDGWKSFGEDDDDMDDSGEFSLNMMPADSNHSGVDDNNPIDYYDRLSRHQKDLASQNLQAIESLARKDGKNPIDEAFMIFPDHSYPNTKMTRRQLRKEMNKGSGYFHDLRMPKINSASKNKELGRLRVEVLQCFGLPTTSLVREVSAYSVAVMGNAAFQSDVIPNVANPMWLSKMRRACLFPVEQMYSQLSIGIFDLEAAYADANTCMGHPGHPGWVPPDQRGGWGMHRAVSLTGRASSVSMQAHRGSMQSHRGSSAHLGFENRVHFGGDSGKNFAVDDDEEKTPPIHRKPAPYCFKAEDFIGHVVVDVCRLRPGSTYDVTLPLRRSNHVFTREPQGSVRIRLHLEWNSERAAVMSYLPKTLGGTVSWQKQPNTRHTVNCVDDRAARNVAHAVHGIHMPGKFDMTLLKSTIREIHWTRIHILRYCKNREIYHLTYWVYPSISGFVFLAWMHAVYFETVRYVPGHIVVFFLLHLLKNYAYYAMDSPLQNGFQAPSLEELYWALMSGTKKRKKPCIEPLTVEREADPISDQDRVFDSSMSGTSAHNMDELYDENGNLVHVSRFPLSVIAEAMKKSLNVRPHRKGFTVFKHTFQGDDAVDFLVLNGFAMTRPEAVSVGRRLEREKHLFQHIGKENFFEDSNYLYCFLDSETERYLVQRSHVPAGARLLEILGFYSRKGRAGGKNQKKGRAKPGGADILESREHVEFPFATGVDHPRFTVKESLVIRSAEEKSRFNKEDEAKAMVEVAEFGIVPTTQASFGRTSFGSSQQHGHSYGSAGYESENGTRNTGINRRGSQKNLMAQAYGGNGGGEQPRPARRGSSLGTALANGATAVAAGANTMTASLAETIRGTNLHNKMVNSGNHSGSGHMNEVATGEEMLYNKLYEQNNATLDRVMELQRKADEYDPYQYDSDNDVKTIQKKKRKKHVIFEKHLKKPISQDFGNMGSTAVDMSLGKSLEKSKRHVNALFHHMFDDQLYKIDKNLFPIRLVEKTDNQVKKKKKRGLFNRRASNRELEEEEERQKKLQMTPYEQQQEEMDKVLMINQYSHYNPWINRIAIVMQPLMEMAQTFLFAFRALFNVFTWQDPVLCFWLCFAGPPLAFVLYVCPYRIISFFLGFYWIGPQNYVSRIYRESKEGYEPPNFDLIIKKKKIEKPEDFQEMQFFSSEAPGNQPIQFRNIDPVQVKQIVVPSNVMMYGSRFYDWPPEPKYARVYASEAPSNLLVPGFAEHSSNNNNNNMYGYESDSTYVFDQAARKKSEEEREKVQKKKLKKGVGRKITDGLKKTTQISMGVVGTAGGAVVTGTEQVFGATAGVTVGAVNRTAHITKSVVKGTSKQAKSAAKGTGNFLRLRKRNQRRYKDSRYNYSDDDDDDEDEYY